MFAFLGNDWIFAHGLFYRANALFRSKIAKKLFQFRSNTTGGLSSSFAKTDRCAAIHIRRGDRAIDALTGVDHISYCNYCRPFANYKDKIFEIPEKNIRIPCSTDPYGNPDVVQLGCSFGNVSFGAYTLLDYLHAVETVTNGDNGVRTVVIMTDSGDWLERQQRELPLEVKSKWTLRVLPAEVNNRAFTTPNGVNFLASLEAIRQCEYFVGMTSCSFAARYILGAMCMRHGINDRNNGLVDGENVKFMQCPPFYDTCGRDISSNDRFGIL